MRRIDWSNISTGLIVGGLLAAAGTFFAIGRDVAELQARVDERAARTADSSPPAIASRHALSLEPASPDSLVLIIRALQRDHVKESFGEFANQNFSTADLQRFIRDGVPVAIADSLRRDAGFLSVVLGLASATATDRQRVFRTADQPLRRTWAELGGITREGTTEAGQEAERRIARQIVTLARSLMLLPADSLARLASQ